ncbi:(4Fe-4S)-binding protein [bacterium]|nr:(4Fe-4S)-binding protein [bacterium]
MRDYKNKQITVFWESKLCIHSGNCVRGLPSVFDLKKHPWINVDAENADTIAQAIDRCPSGALSYKRSENL